MDPKVLEKEAHTLLTQHQPEEAFKLFRKAALVYKEQGDHQKAALCFTSAASCWSLLSGEKTFYNSASSYEEASREAEKFGDFEYAALLYRYAAISYERDAEFSNFSECFYRSKECQRRFYSRCFLNPGKIHHITPTQEGRGLRCMLRRVFLWLALTFSFLVWGHGERPARTLFCGIALILFSAFFYTFGHLSEASRIFQPNFWQAFYFSVVTFTTVGYGDITPVGLSKLIVVAELFCGMFIMPLFIISLARKYLRI